MSLWSRRLVVVAGKGGVGRTTVAACIAMAAASEGRRVALVELHGLASVGELFGAEGRSYAPFEVTPGVDWLSLTPTECLDEYGVKTLKIGALVRLVFHNRVMASFLDAVPGLHDLLQLGKIHNMLLEPGPRETHYDLAVLDAPATGHGLTLLAAARAMAEMTRVGPFFDIASQLRALVEDPARTVLVLVTLPEELVVNETIELVRGLGDLAPLLGAIAVNQIAQEPLPDVSEWPRVRPAFSGAPHQNAQRLVALVDDAIEHARFQRNAMQRLFEEAPAAAGRPLAFAKLPHSERTVDGRTVSKLARLLVHSLEESA